VALIKPLLATVSADTVQHATSSAQFDPIGGHELEGRNLIGSLFSPERQPSSHLLPDGCNLLYVYGKILFR
jgi:hypothetical protein